MNFSNLSVKRPVTTIMLLMIVVLLGVVSVIGIPMDLFPEIEAPVALVMVSYPNASPEEIETMITKPLENQLASVEDMDEMISMSTAGSSVTVVQFQMGTDMNFATLNMREKVDLISDYLPENSSAPMIMKMNMNSTPVMQIYVSGNMPLDELYAKVNDTVVSSFERTSGVASVSVTGGLEREVAVTLDQERLMGYGLTLASMSQMLSAENMNRPSGSVNKGNTELIVRTIGEFNSVEDVERYPITLRSGEVIRLGDIASVEERYQDQNSISRMDGHTAIGISVTKQSAANTVDVCKSIQKSITKLEKGNSDLEFTVGFDQSDFIMGSVSSIAQSAILGALLAVIIIFLFLKNIGSTAIIAISIPASFLATFALMKYTGMTLNMLTLCGLTLGVGMLVDNSVIVLENIYRINQKINNPMEASITGSRQVFMAIIASTLTSVVVYLPIAFSGGFASMMFKDFCFTIVFSLLASLIMSLTVVPMLCSRILRKEVHTDYMRVGMKRYKFKLVPKFTKFIANLTEGYVSSIRYALSHRKKTMIACLCIFLVSLTLISLVGAELLPATDEGSFSVSVTSPYGTSLKERDKMVSEMEQYLLSIPEAEHVSIQISSTSFMGGQSTTSTLDVSLVDKSQRKKSTGEIVKQVKKQFKNVVGAEVTVAESSMISGMMGGSAVSLSIFGDDLEVLKQIGNDLSTQISDVKGVVGPSLDMEEGNPEVRVVLNRNTSSKYGITAYQLADALESSLSGSTSTKLKVNGSEIEINLALNDTYGTTVDNMKQILVASSTGQMVPVGEVADFEFDNSPTVINHQNQQRVLTFSCGVDGRDLGSVSKDVMKVVENYPFPDGYYVNTGGQQDQMTEAFGSLALALVTSILLVYMLLAAQFESLVLPIIVMIAIPFAMSGAFLALFFAGMRLSMTSLTSLIMLIGMVVNNSILLVEFIKLNEQDMGRDAAIIEAGRSRLRPILMTTITTVVGMIPLSLGLGDGGEILAPMGVSIIGGLLGSTVAALILVPVLYASDAERRLRKGDRKREKEEKIAALETQWAQEGINEE